MTRFVTLWELLVQLIELHTLIDRMYQTSVLARGWYCPAEDARALNLQVLAQGVEGISKACANLGLSMSCLEARDVIQSLRAYANMSKWHGEHTKLEIARSYDHLISSIRNETSQQLYFHVPEKSRELYENMQPFGERVWRAFPKAIHDIEEAAKCLALNRATACAMHCMRAIDIGLSKLIAESFGDPDYLTETSEWGKIVHRIHKEADKKDGKIAKHWLGRGMNYTSWQSSFTTSVSPTGIL